MCPVCRRSWARETAEPPRVYGTSKLFVVIARTGWIDRPRTEAPKTQIHFTTHRSGAFLVLRQRTVVRGERASRSIVNTTTPLWSTMIMASRTLADVGSVPVLVYSRGRAGAKSLWNKQFYVKRCNLGGVDLSRTEAGHAQIYLTTHGSGAVPVLRLRTVVRGERASRSIVNRTTALWSIWIVASLILAGLGSESFFI